MHFHFFSLIYIYIKEFIIISKGTRGNTPDEWQQGKNNRYLFIKFPFNTFQITFAQKPCKSLHISSKNPHQHEKHIYTYHTIAGSCFLFFYFLLSLLSALCLLDLGKKITMESNSFVGWNIELLCIASKRSVEGILWELVGQEMMTGHRINILIN